MEFFGKESCCRKHGISRRCSYHNHTDLSDGASSPEELCRTGKALGLRELGVSDHWVIPPFDGSDAAEWRLAPERLAEYVERLLKLKTELDDENFTLRLGLEVDFFFENVDEVLKELSLFPLDYLIGSVHYAGNFPIDHDSADWAGLSPQKIDEICETFWKKMEGAAARKEFAFLGHLDLPKKYGFVKSSDWLPQACRVLDAVQQNGGAIELNTAGWFKACKEAYPSPEILREAKKRGIPVILSADAHASAHLTRNFTEAEELLRQS